MPHLSTFPSTRLRRLRASPWIRELVRETRLHPSDFIWPVFITEGSNVETPITTMPGVSRLTIDLLVKRAKEAHELGIQAIALFPQVDPAKKTDEAEEALNANNLICRAVKTLKDKIPNLGIITDIALDPYTSHGHDGIVKNGVVANDETVEILAKQAVLMAQSGADIVAPSDMMDGRVSAIRAALEASNLPDTAILSYAAKYASAMYGPFRDAVGSKVKSGYLDKRSYQMDPANSDEAMREMALDIAEGADMVMVKPGLPYLDIIQRASQQFDVPVFAYHVSGEYAAVMHAGAAGALDARAVFLEQMISFKRAGTRAILTYAATELAKWISE